MIKPQFGTWCEIPSPYAVHIMAKAGFDFIIIDMEHGVIDFELAQNMIFAAHSEKCKAYIRVPAIEEAYVLRALDTGADGVVFPQVSSVADVKQIIKFSKFAPEGDRGFNPYITAGGYTNVSADYFENENQRTEMVTILEGKEAFNNIDALLQDSHIDIVYIGQYDLSMALGVPGDVNNAIVIEKMDEAVKKIRANGKMAGCMVHTIDEAKKFCEKGFNFIVFKVDTGIFYDAVHGFVEGVKS